MAAQRSALRLERRERLARVAPGPAPPQQRIGAAPFPRQPALAAECHARKSRAQVLDL